MTAYVSDFADLAVTLPVLLVVCATLAVQGAVQQAAIFALATLVTLAAISTVKFASFVVLQGQNPLHLHSPSGHTAVAVMVYGGLLQLLGPGVGLSRGLRLAGGLGVAVLIAYTRVRLHAHSLSDVLVGALVGGGGLLLLIGLGRLRPILPQRAARPWPVLLGAAVAMGVMHGHHLGGEQTLRNLADSPDDDALLSAPACDAPSAIAAPSLMLAAALPGNFRHA